MWARSICRGSLLRFLGVPGDLAVSFPLDEVVFLVIDSLYDLGAGHADCTRERRRDKENDQKL